MKYKVLHTIGKGPTANTWEAGDVVEHEDLPVDSHQRLIDLKAIEAIPDEEQNAALASVLTDEEKANLEQRIADQKAAADEAKKLAAEKKRADAAAKKAQP